MFVKSIITACVCEQEKLPDILAVQIGKVFFKQGPSDAAFAHAAADCKKGKLARVIFLTLCQNPCVYFLHTLKNA